MGIGAQGRTRPVHKDATEQLVSVDNGQRNGGKPEYINLVGNGKVPGKRIKPGTLCTSQNNN